MRLVFCIYDFTSGNLALQPWLTIQRLAEAFSSRNYDVHLVSDVVPAEIPGVEGHGVDSLRGLNSPDLRKLIGRLRPDALVFLPTPLNMVTSGWMEEMPARLVGFASYPFYTSGELLRGARCLGIRDTSSYLKHMLAPRPLWISTMRRLHATVAQSESTADRLAGWVGGAARVRCIPPGIDLSQWPMSAGMGERQRDYVQLLYLGAAIPIRGFEVALNAMQRLGSPDVRLRVLARGAEGEALRRIEAEVAGRGLRERVDVVGGWMDRDRLIREIHEADAVLQPFVLVPSELPVTAMEVIACGTPVIGSAIDGLPSTIGSAGTVVPPGDAGALARAIDRLADSPDMRRAWQEGCRKQREAMLNWDEVADRWEDVLHG